MSSPSRRPLWPPENGHLPPSLPPRLWQLQLIVPTLIPLRPPHQLRIRKWGVTPPCRKPISSPYPANAPGLHRLRPLSGRANCDPWMNRGQQMTPLQLTLRLPKLLNFLLQTSFLQLPRKLSLLSSRASPHPNPLPFLYLLLANGSLLFRRYHQGLLTQKHGPFRHWPFRKLALLHRRRHPPSMTRYQNYRPLVLRQSRSHLLCFYRVTPVRICLLLTLPQAALCSASRFL